MKKIIKNMAFLAVCVFTFVAIGNVCSETKIEPANTVDAKLIVPAPVRKGHELEGILVG